jgi:hypothetical protein
MYEDEIWKPLGLCDENIFVANSTKRVGTAITCLTRILEVVPSSNLGRNPANSVCQAECWDSVSEYATTPLPGYTAVGYTAGLSSSPFRLK